MMDNPLEMTPEREERIRRALQSTRVHAGSRVLAAPDPAGLELDALMAEARQDRKSVV